MTTLSERLKIIIAEMDGPDRGKQTRLAVIADCTRATMSQYLKKPGAEIGYLYAKNISDQLGYNVDWLILGRGDPREAELKTAPVTLAYILQEEAHLLTMYRESDKDGKDYIIRSAALTEKFSRTASPLR